MNSTNSELSEDASLKNEEPTLKAEMVTLREEIKALREKITEEKEEAEEIPQKPAIRKILKCYKKTGVKKDLVVNKDLDVSKDLDVRKMVITPDNKYLITCSEIQLGKKPSVCVWSLDKILQKIEKEKHILKGKIKAKDEVKKGESEERKREETGNWLLCVDALTTKLNDKDIWIVCAGSIKGDVFIWSGSIDEKSKEWNLRPTFYHKNSEGDEIQKAIFDIKITEEKIPDNLKKNEKKTVFKIYFSSNTIGVYTKDKTENNCFKELLLSPLGQGKDFTVEKGTDFDQQDEWILSFDLYKEGDTKLLISGSNDNEIYKWNLEDGTYESIGHHHENGVTCVKISNDGSKVASGCLDNVVKVWDLNEKKCILEKYDHTKEIVSIVFQQDNKYLVTASKDSNIKVWNIADQVMVRNIDLNKELKIYNSFMQQKKNDLKKEMGEPLEVEGELILKQHGPGLDFLRQVLLSPKDQYIFAIKKNKILILRNYGRIWHFYQQLKYLEVNFPKLFKKIYGPNLKQIAKNLDDNEDSLGKIYNEIKKRATKSSIAYNPRLLGPLFVPSFVKYEEEKENQKIYINSVRTNYKSYWYGATKMIQEVPDLQWKFKLFLSTDISEQIEQAKYIEISNFKSSSKNRPNPHIILKDRNQSQVRFLMVLDRVPTTFIPLLKAVTLDIEDDRGDKDTLIFTDFKLSSKNVALTNANETENEIKNKDKKGFPLNILKRPYNSIKDVQPYREFYDKPEESLPKQFYYSHCIFKLDERYCVKSIATVKVRKITVEMTESLNPFESKKKIKGDVELFEAFRNNFLAPPTPEVNIKIGKGPRSTIGKILDKYLAGLIGLDFLFT
ncbi:MAG: hypothetical protein ACW98D_06810, partial [Promethearchaeota archaeon]